MDGYGSPRGGVPRPDMHHRGVSHENLKAMTDAGEPAASEEIADGWASMGNSLEQAGILLQQAVFGSESGWTGQTADAMRYRLAQVAEWSMKTGQGFTTSSSAVRDQSAAVGEAKTRMPEPVPYDPNQMIDDAVQGGFVDIIMLPQRMYEQKQKSDAAYYEAVQVVAARDGQLATGAAAMPAFSAPPVLSNDGGGRSPEPGGPSPGGRPPGGDGGPIGPGYPGAGPVGGPGPASGGSGPSAVGPGPSGPAPWPGQSGQGGTGSGLTTPDTYIPPDLGRPVVPVGMGPGPNPLSGQGPGFGPFGGFPPGGFGPGTGFDPARGGGGSAGGGAGGGADGGGSRGGGLGRGLGGGAGMGAGGAAEAAAGGRGAAGARGGAGMAGMPMGGGHGQADEDTEHQRPAWLLEDNPESLFGSDEMTAPPVIGE